MEIALMLARRIILILGVEQYIDGDDVQQLAGALLVIASVAWSIVATHLRRKDGADDK